MRAYGRFRDRDSPPSRSSTVLRLSADARTIGVMTTKPARTNTMRSMTVRIPVPATVRGGRGGRARTGWVWVDRSITVPDLASDARCTVVQLSSQFVVAPFGDVGRRIEGACAGGGHWRGNGILPTDDSVVRPFDLTCEIVGGTDEAALRVEPVGRLRGRPTPSRKTDTDLSSRSRTWSRISGVGPSDQRALERAYAASGACPDTTTPTPGPFPLRRSCLVTVEDVEFEGALLDRASRTLAYVDGEPMARSEPPSTLVVLSLGGWRSPWPLRVRTAYADAFPLASHDVAAVLPHASHATVVEDLVRTTERSRDWSKVSMTAVPEHEGITGSVVTPSAPRGPIPTPVHGAHVLGRNGSLASVGPVHGVLEPVERIEMAKGAEIRASDRGWTSGMASVVEWCRDLETRHEPTMGVEGALVPRAAAALDGLDAPSFPGPV